MNISEINKVEEIGHFEFVSENDLGKITKDGNKHFAVVKYKNTYSGDRKISERSMVIYFICKYFLTSLIASFGSITLIVVIPNFLAGFKFMPRSSR